MAILPDVLRPGLRIVFCGSAAGRLSAQAGAYYAHPGNKFWPTLYRIGLTPRRLAPEQFGELPKYGMGLTDLCKAEFGADSELSPAADDPEGLKRKIDFLQPRVLAFVGKRPAKVFLKGIFLKRSVAYGPQPEKIGRTAIFVLPSPAPTARAYWDESWWHKLAASYRPHCRGC